MKIFNFYNFRNHCILHGLVFVMSADDVFCRTTAISSNIVFLLNMFYFVVVSEFVLSKNIMLIFAFFTK